MIIDCFPFFNELDLLDIRLKLLDDIVDKVIDAFKKSFEDLREDGYL